MNTLTKLALGLIGQLHAEPATGKADSVTHLPPAKTSGGMPLMQALSARLATVIRAWMDRTALGKAMGLGNDQQVLLSQTVGRLQSSAHCGA